MKNKSVIFWQDWGTYSQATIVVCGLKNYEELIQELKKMKKPVPLEWAALIKHLTETEDRSSIAQNPHATSWQDKDKVECSIVWLPSWNATPHDYAVLAHELIHLCTQQMKYMMDIVKENEAFAYQHTYLFKSIVSRLNDIYKK